MNFWTHEGFGKARELLHQAIAVDPESARARREIAWLAVVGLISGLDKPPVPPQEIVAQASQAVLLDPSDGRAHMVAAAAYYFNKQLDLFEHEAKQAMALAPYDAESLATLAYMTATSGDWPRGGFASAAFIDGHSQRTQKLIAPIDVPMIQSGSIPASCSA